MWIMSVFPGQTLFYLFSTFAGNVDFRVEECSVCEFWSIYPHRKKTFPHVYQFLSST